MTIKASTALVDAPFAALIEEIERRVPAYILEQAVIEWRRGAGRGHSLSEWVEICEESANHPLGIAKPRLEGVYRRQHPTRLELYPPNHPAVDLRRGE